MDLTAMLQQQQQPATIGPPAPLFQAPNWPGAGFNPMQQQPQQAAINPYMIPQLSNQELYPGRGSVLSSDESQNRLLGLYNTAIDDYSTRSRADARQQVVGNIFSKLIAPGMMAFGAPATAQGGLQLAQMAESDLKDARNRRQQDLSATIGTITGIGNLVEKTSPYNQKRILAEAKSRIDAAKVQQKGAATQLQETGKTTRNINATVEKHLTNLLRYTEGQDKNTRHTEDLNLQKQKIQDMLAENAKNRQLRGAIAKLQASVQMRGMDMATQRFATGLAAALAQNEAKLNAGIQETNAKYQLAQHETGANGLKNPGFEFTPIPMVDAEMNLPDDLMNDPDIAGALALVQQAGAQSQPAPSMAQPQTQPQQQVPVQQQPQANALQMAAFDQSGNINQEFFNTHRAKFDAAMNAYLKDPRPANQKDPEFQRHLKYPPAVVRRLLGR